MLEPHQVREVQCQTLCGIMIIIQILQGQQIDLTKPCLHYKAMAGAGLHI